MAKRGAVEILIAANPSPGAGFLLGKARFNYHRGMSISHLKTCLSEFAAALAQIWEGYWQSPTAC